MFKEDYPLSPQVGFRHKMEELDYLNMIDLSFPLQAAGNVSDVSK